MKGADTNYYRIFAATNCGKHNAPIRCVEYNQDRQVVLTGSWDSTVKIWDARAPTNCVGSHSTFDEVILFNLFKNILWFCSATLYYFKQQIFDMQFKNAMQVYTMSVKDEMLIVGTAGRKILVWDLRNMDSPLQQRDSLLKYQTRCLRIFPNKQVRVICLNAFSINLFARSMLNS